MKYLDSYDPDNDNSVDSFDEFMMNAINKRQAENPTHQISKKTVPIKKEIKPKQEVKPLKEIAKIIVFDISTGIIDISLYGKRRRYEGASLYIKEELEKYIKNNRKTKFFNILKDLKTIS
jgi:hypothetical protein